MYKTVVPCIIGHIMIFSWQNVAILFTELYSIPYNLRPPIQPEKKYGLKLNVVLKYGYLCWTYKSGVTDSDSSL